MPFGSRDKNLWFVVAVVFVSISIVTSMVGQIMFNTRAIEFVKKQNEDLAGEHAKILQNQILILDALRRVESKLALQ